MIDAEPHSTTRLARSSIRVSRGASTAQMPATQIRVLGGAMARVPNEATAFAHRDRRLMVNVAPLYGEQAERATHQAWVGGFAQALQRGPAGAYVNFLGDEGEARVRQAYPGATWERLAQIKGRYDPTNLFRGEDPMHDVRTVTTVETMGRFSTGMERPGPSSEKDRIGRFSTGMERPGPSSEKDRIGRFSTGMERLGPSSEKDRIGRFTTGLEQLRFEDSWLSPSRAAGSTRTSRPTVREEADEVFTADEHVGYGHSTKRR